LDRDDNASRTRVFLSYARADRTRVAKLAAALEAAQLDVWWDPTIEVGSTFANDIARELEAADVVVVAWSAASINSAWVLDEAAVGRDRGRLVPILIDPVKPPLGFRQLQTINLSAWRGRQTDPRLAAVVGAVQRIGANAAAPPTVTSPRSRFHNSRTMLWILGLMAAAIGLGVGWQLLAPVPSEKPVVAVLPFTDISAAKGEAYFAEGLAEEVLDTLARDGRLKVLGRETARAIRERAGDPTYARGKLGVTRLLEGSVRSGDDAGIPRVRVSVRLIDTRTGFEIWSQSFDRSGGDVISIEEEVANAVAIRIAGPLDSSAATSPATTKVAPEAYEAIVIARQLIRARQAESLRRALAMADRAIAIAPGYAPAYAARSAAVTLSTRYGEEQTATALPKARRDAETAIRLDPGLSDGYDALSLMFWFKADYPHAIGAAQRAIEHRPDNAEAHLHLAAVYYEDEQPIRAIAEFTRASSLDPLWVAPVGSLIDTYSVTNQPVAGRAAADRFRSLSLDQAETDLVESYFANGSGNFAQGIKFADAAIARTPTLTLAVQIRDTLMSALFAGQGAGAHAGSDATENRLGALRDRAGAASIAARMGTKIWDDPQSAAALASALVAGDRSALLVRDFDLRFAGVAAYAASTLSADRSTIPLALALDQAGRATDARAMRDLARNRLLRAESAGVAPAQNSIDWAGLLLAEGNRAGAVARLETGLKVGWWMVCSGPFWLGDLPTLAPLRGDARFESILGQCRSRINAERKMAGMGSIPLP
jgi:TolB-like protein